MNREKLLNVLKKPRISEKSASSSGGYSQYVFQVAKESNKYDIKSAVEELFKVKVKKVTVVNHKGAKATKFGRAVGRYASFKKAYVVLEANNEIAFV